MHLQIVPFKSTECMRQKENDCLSYKRNAGLKGKIGVETFELPFNINEANLTHRNR